jgi:hypothetical protein
MVKFKLLIRDFFCISFGFSIIGITYLHVPFFLAARWEGAERRMQTRDSRLNTAGEASTELLVFFLAKCCGCMKLGFSFTHKFFTFRVFNKTDD